MASIAINDVEVPTHVESGVFPTIGAQEMVLQEVYAGNIIVQMNNGGAPTSRITYKTFLPLFGNTVRFYPGAEIIESAVMVAPAGFSANEDEQFLCSIDGFDLKLEPQSLPGGNPPCLVLSFDAALLNGTLHRVAYHVTVQTPRADLEEQELREDARPA